MAQATQLKLQPFTPARTQELALAVLSEHEAKRNRMAIDILASGANFQPELLDKANIGGIDEGFFFAPDAFTDLAAAGPAYVTTPRSICISQSRSDAQGQVQYQDAICVTHFAVEFLSPITLADLDKLKYNLGIKIDAPDNVERPTIVPFERLIDWATIDMEEMAAARDTTASTTVGRFVYNLPKYGIWEQGLRRLPRPLFIVEGQAASWTPIVKAAAAPTGTSGLLCRTRFRYSRLRGVTGK